MKKSTKIAIAVGGTVTFVGAMASLSEDPMTQEASQVSVNGPTTEATVVETPVVTEAPETTQAPVTTQAPPPITAPQVITTEVTLDPDPEPFIFCGYDHFSPDTMLSTYQPDSVDEYCLGFQYFYEVADAELCAEFWGNSDADLLAVIMEADGVTYSQAPRQA